MGRTLKHHRFRSQNGSFLYFLFSFLKEGADVAGSHMLTHKYYTCIVTALFISAPSIAMCHDFLCLRPPSTLKSLFISAFVAVSEVTLFL